jgi:hypothetical protein
LAWGEPREPSVDKRVVKGLFFLKVPAWVYRYLLYVTYRHKVDTDRLLEDLLYARREARAIEDVGLQHRACKPGSRSEDALALLAAAPLAGIEVRRR